MVGEGTTMFYLNIKMRKSVEKRVFFSFLKLVAGLREVWQLRLEASKFPGPIAHRSRENHLDAQHP
jgi:hypothetical protein